ncbi:unnamed protein product [Lathyrus sativus]|nr:unnamed protein product [Lathyrus sativus]
MSALLNESTIEDFVVERGLHQGDSLSPFLFIIVMEGLTTMVNKAVEIGTFRGFHYHEEDSVDVLQFANDTIILGEGTYDNFWSLKAIMMGFEMMSGFCKRKMYDINLNDCLLNTASSFLSCNIDSFPFRFLGVLVGDSPRKSYMWKELIKSLQRKLVVWRGKHLSMAGKVVLINSVMNVIPVYTLSFYKAPAKVLLDIWRIQSNFLWRGCVDNRTVHWVSWRNVCNPKDKDELRVKDIKVLNKGLLLKWKWRILKEKDAIWCKLLCHRYGKSDIKVMIGNNSIWNKHNSIWWRDLVLSVLSTNYGFSIFVNNLHCRIGYGSNTLFWHVLRLEINL